MYFTYIDCDIEIRKLFKWIVQCSNVENTDPFVKQPFYFAIADNLEDFVVQVGYLY